MSLVQPGPSGVDNRTIASLRSSLRMLGDSFDLQRLLVRFRRHLPLFAATAATVFLIGAVVTLQATPVYTSTANVMLDVREESVTDVTAVLSGLPADSAVVDTEVKIIQSRELAERVIKALKLEQDPEFNVSLREPGALDAVKTFVGNLLAGNRPDALLPAVEQQQRVHEKSVDKVLANLKVQREDLTYVINVSYTSTEPAKAALIANKFAELYLLEQLEAKFDATKQATVWLNSRLGELRNQVQASEAAVQQYKISNNLMSSSGTTLTEQEISSYNQSLASARASLAEEQARLATSSSQISRGSTGDDTEAALGSTVVSRLREQQADARRNVAELASKYGERHPDLLQAKQQLSEIENQIQQEIGRVTSNLQARVQIARQRVSALEGSLGGARQTLATNNQSSVRLGELERNATADRSLYETYLARFRETSTQQGNEQTDSRIVSKATIPTSQSAPNVSLNLALSVVLGLLAGLAAAVIAELLDSGMTTAEDIERQLEVPYLGAIPLLDSVAKEDANSPPAKYVTDHPLSAFSESFRGLRAAIHYARLGEKVKVIGITSPLPGEGKTTTSICLGRVAAMQGAKVIVVDCDLRRQTFNRLLDSSSTVGLLEVLNGDIKLEEALVIDQQSGAHFLPLARGKTTPRDIFGTLAIDELLAELRAKYDLVILDTAPVLPVADTRVLAPKLDVMVLLTRWRKTPKHATIAALRMISSTGAHIAGVALTQMDMRQQAKYGYGDAGYYYSEYKSYYT